MANSRLFTAHFLLLKDGTLGPWPVVEIADSGEVLSVELHPEGLKERPGLQLHGGLLMAGLMDVGPIDSSLIFSQRVLNKHFASGTLYLSAETGPGGFYSPPFLMKNLEQSECSLSFVNRTPDNYHIPLLERIRQHCLLNPSLNWLKMISEAAEWSSAQRNDLADKGCIEPGCKSGLMVVKNLDLKSLAMSEDMAVKWLVVPEQM